MVVTRTAGSFVCMGKVQPREADVKTEAVPTREVSDLDQADEQTPMDGGAQLALGAMGGGGRISKIGQRHPIMLGALVGFLWGVSMRLWMRFISTDPEFSWSGTIFIIGGSVFVGSILGVAWWRRAAGGVGWWRSSILSLLLLGAGGSVMWPTVILWAAAIGRRRPWWLVAPLAVGGVVAQVPVLNDALVGNWRFGTTEMIVAGVWYAPMLALEAWAFSVVFGRGLSEVAPKRLKLALTIIPVVAVSAMAVVLVGLPG